MPIDRTIRLNTRFDCLDRDEIPQQAIDALTVPGRDASREARYWRIQLGFEIPREEAIAGLLRYGAWEREELEGKTTEELAEIVLWLAAGDFNEGMEIFTLGD